MAKPRDFKKEYEYHGKPEQIKNRASRNAARAKMEKMHGKAAIEGMDVDHKKPLAEGGTNNAKNLKLESPAVNRARKTKKK